MAASVLLNNSQEISRQEIQTAIAKAAELRALHAALLQGNSPANLKLQACASPSGSRSSNPFSAQDYPVFTPSYDEEPLPNYSQILSEDRRLSQNWDTTGVEDNDAREMEEETADETDLTFKKKQSPLSRDALSSGVFIREQHICSSEKPSATCNKCKPATIMRDNQIPEQLNTTQVSDSPQKNGKPILSWLFPRLKKKTKQESSLNRVEPADNSQAFKDWGFLPLESLKKELIEATQKRDTALTEVSEMKSSMTELKQKLASLESYCEELKLALKQAVQGKETQVPERPNLTKKGKGMETLKENPMPVSHEVMVEGFLQVVSEARLSAKQFSRTLVTHLESTDENFRERISLLLKPYNLNINSRFSRGVLYHLEALINQAMYQDFENCSFQKNGSPTILDPERDRQAKFASFVSLRNLSWNEVLRKGTKVYSEEFSRFCDQKMSCLISVLNWSRPWPEPLLQSFFIAAKCVWLLHLLAFSFGPPLMILRVEENRSFDPAFMEDILVERRRMQSPSKVRIMVMPGFYVQDKVLRCKVLCRYRSVA
ncbi:hypothetical protein AMTRI_Chr03g139160 [Amborella trichopoda]|uniref:IRK-interacting protein n=1 Tax=Amborella trichopoda TaxID=13333 RepID=W1PNW1_AMBTC|nr:IRK-interacting protein [Amborella trichopoda]ERN11682.1 hypothetical protein AMTR_s00022p00222930 [Amborella trichopoda]|eukprot:XP_006850101.1 IRK-interacting protein [Amborella trichopoda]